MKIEAITNREAAMTAGLECGLLEARDEFHGTRLQGFENLPQVLQDTFWYGFDVTSGFEERSGMSYTAYMAEWEANFQARQAVKVN